MDHTMDHIKVSKTALPKDVVEKMIQNANATPGCRFASVRYKAKTTGEIAKHIILLGASLENAYKRDLEKLKAYEPKDEHESAVRAELIASIQESLDKGIGNNSRYTQKNLERESIGKNVREDKYGRKQIAGITVGKVVIQEGVYPNRKSYPKTIARNRIKRDLKLTKFRSLCVEADCIEYFKTNGKTVIAD